MLSLKKKISHHFKTIIQKGEYPQESKIFNQPTVMKAQLQHEPDEMKIKIIKRTKVRTTLTSGQMSPVGERTKYLAPLCLSFDVVCQVTASTAVFSVFNIYLP